MSEIRLKSCPFCGGEVYIEDLGTEKGDHYYMMQCTNEDCDAATCFGEKSKGKFIEAWNTRKPMERIVERLEEEYKDAQKEYSEAKYTLDEMRSTDRGYIAENYRKDMNEGRCFAFDDAIEIVKGRWSR